MRYVSTRGQAGTQSFEDVLLAGLAGDGGLFVPETWPSFAPGFLEGLAGKSYQQAAVEVDGVGGMGQQGAETVLRHRKQRFIVPERVVAIEADGVEGLAGGGEDAGHEPVH